MKRSLAFLFCSLPVMLSLIAQDHDHDQTRATIGIQSAFSFRMLEANQDLRKVDVLLEERAHDALEDKSLTVGMSLIALGDYQRSNRDSKFGYLMRHPTPANQIGRTVTEAVVHSAQLSLTGTVNSWLTAHAEILYDPEQSFGGGTITDLNRNQLQLRKGFIVLGDLTKFPLYGAIGKMDTPFGQMGSVSPFSNSTMWHAFGGLAYGAQIGFRKWNVHASVMAVQGGAQFRALNAPVVDSSSVPSRINNYTLDLNYTLHAGDDVHLIIGGSYMRGSAYCQEFPVTHFQPGRENNPAYSYYGRISFWDRLFIKGSFTETTEVWPGTFNPTPPLDIYEASRVSALDYGARYVFRSNGVMEYAISGEFSRFKAGPEGAPWERQSQIIAGFSAMYKQSSRFFLELFRTEGYAPLNFISGSDPFEPFPPGVTHSERDARSFGLVLGAQIVL